MPEFDKWIEAHRNWRMRLRDFVEGTSTETLDPSIIDRDNVCDLGQWIHGAKASMAGYAPFAELLQLHAQFHKTAANVVRTCAAGDKTRAAKLIDTDSEFMRLSSKVVGAIGKVARDTKK
jgi:hypothetical protein